MTRKKVNFDAVCFPLVFLERKKINIKKIFCSVNAKNISSQMLNISEILLILRTREFTDIFITVDKIRKAILYFQKTYFPTFVNYMAKYMHANPDVITKRKG